MIPFLQKDGFHDPPKQTIPFIVVRASFEKETQLAKMSPQSRKIEVKCPHSRRLSTISGSALCHALESPLYIFMGNCSEFPASKCAEENGGKARGDATKALSIKFTPFGTLCCIALRLLHCVLARSLPLTLHRLISLPLLSSFLAHGQERWSKL